MFDVYVNTRILLDEVYSVYAAGYCLVRTWVFYKDGQRVYHYVFKDRALN